MDIIKKLCTEFSISENRITNIVTLLDDGNTVPFIARYRKEMTGYCDDQTLREIFERLTYLRNLQDRKEEVKNSIENQGKLAKEILKDCNLYKKTPTLIACPTCGRTQIDLIPIAKEVEDFLQTIESDITVAVMGCAVNGPGEAREADIGIAGGIKEGILFKKGKIIKKVKQEDIVDTLKSEILQMIDQKNK